ncbi:MAG: hypothetical protein ACI9GH_000106 [Candidatus Paceibacteria bacterium]|jgi:hypothetical protein
MLKTLTTVFKQPVYILISLVVFSVVASLALLAPNFGLIFQVLGSFGVMEALKVSFSLLGSIQTNFTVFSATTILLIAFFFAINISLFVYYVKRFKETAGVGTSTLGLVIGTLGVGCASCGSLVLTSLLSLVGLGGTLSFLPFGGEEFSVIGLVLIVVSMYYLLKKISGPAVCEV